MASAFGVRYTFQAPGLVGRVARMAVAADGLISLVLAVAAFRASSGSGAFRIPPLDGSGQGFTMFSFYPPPLDAITGVGAAVSLLSGAAWLVWQHRATSNVWAVAGPPQPRVSPGWAVGWWFIPVANLWMPFIAMRELRRRSADRSGRAGGSAATIMVVWWVVYLLLVVTSSVAVAWILGVVFSAIVDAAEAGRTSVFVTVRDVDTAIRVLAAAYVIRAVAAAAALAVIGDIERLQASMPSVPWVPAAPTSVLAAPPRPDQR